MFHLKGIKTSAEDLCFYVQADQIGTLFLGLQMRLHQPVFCIILPHFYHQHIILTPKCSQDQFFSMSKQLLKMAGHSKLFSKEKMHRKESKSR